MFLYVYFSDLQKKYQAIQSYNDCVQAGYPILESYPQQCKIPGKRFVNELQLVRSANDESVSLKVSSSSLALSKEDPRNTRYILEGKIVALKDGLGSIIFHEGASSTPVRYFDHEATFDMNNDSVKDVAFLLQAESELGTTLYYVALALSDTVSGGHKGVNALFVGENISPQSVTTSNGIISVSFTENKTKKQKTTVAKIKKYLVTDNVLVEKIK